MSYKVHGETVMNVYPETLLKVKRFKIKALLSQLKNNEGLRQNEIIAEILKEAKEEIMEILGNIFNQYLHEEEVPEKLKKSLAITF